MSAFVSDVRPFLGKNTVNEEGKTLEQFLEDYDPNKYQNPSVTADILVFQKEQKFNSLENGLKLLMIQRKNHPSIGWWALPGGFVEIHEDIDKAAARELWEETGLTDIAMEQLHTFGKEDRDPRTRIVTVAYLALLEAEREVIAGDDAAKAEWFSLQIEKIAEEVVSEKKIDGEDFVFTRKKERYSIRVICEKDTSIKADAEVDYYVNCNTILLQEEFEVVERNNLAFDHPAFILKAYLLLKQRMS